MANQELSRFVTDGKEAFIMIGSNDGGWHDANPRPIHRSIHDTDNHFTGSIDTGRARSAWAGEIHILTRDSMLVMLVASGHAMNQ
jgi:hypothetical protein